MLPGTGGFCKGAKALVGCQEPEYCKKPKGYIENLLSSSKRQNNLPMNIEREVPDLTMPVQDRNLCFGAGILGMARWGWAVGAGGRRRHRQSSNIERNGKKTSLRSQEKDKRRR